MSVAGLQGFTSKINYSNPGGGDGGWQDGSSIAGPFTITVEGIVSGDKVQLRGTNKLRKPADNQSDLGVQVGLVNSLTGAAVTDITADGSYIVAAAYRWMRLILTNVSGGGTVTAAYFGHRPPAS